MSSSFGYEASREIIADDDLPVDIHHRKFAQWLVDRRKAPKDWHDKLRAILLKVDALARNLPATLTRCTGECVPDPHILAPSDGVEPVRWDYYRARLVRDKIIAGASTVKDATNDDDAEAKGAFEGADTAVHDASKERGTRRGAVRAARGQSAGVGRHRADVRTRQHPPRRGADDDEPTRGLRRPAPQVTRATTRQAAGRPRTPGIGTQTRRRRRGDTVHRDVHRRRRVTARREMCRGRRIRESVGSSIVGSVRFDLRGVRGGGANGCGGRGDGTLRAMDAMGARHRRRGHRRRVATVARVHPRV